MKTHAPDSPIKRVMNTDEVAVYLHISKATVYRLGSSKELPATRVGRQLRYRKDRIDACLSEKTGNTAKGK